MNHNEAQLTAFLEDIGGVGPRIEPKFCATLPGKSLQLDPQHAGRKVSGNDVHPGRDGV